MSENKEPLLMDHNYDGIQEFDNPLPGWWLATFYITIIFAAVYYFYYEISGGPSLAQELEVAMKDIKSHAQAPASVVSEIDFGKIKDPETIAAGKIIYSQKCAACHAPEGQGQIGPNLTDKFWIHGKATPADILQVVTKGVTDKGMPAWETMMKPEELLQSVAYIISLQGTNPPNPKAPQGQEVGN